MQVPLEIVSEAPEADEFYFRQIMGFKLIDQDSRVLGLISSHYDSGAQEVLVIKGADGTTIGEVPYLKEWLIRMDFDQKELHMKLPEGLFEL